ncbi:MAG: right-handed parallel beta-helix repeat-containing protein [Actinomycetes bacterium]
MTSTRIRVAVVVAAVTALAMSAAPTAFAGGYPLPENPGTISKPTKSVKKLVASKTCTTATANAHTCFSTLAAAVAAAKQTGKHKYEYTITITAGTWREPVLVEGHQFDGLTITGSTGNAADTVIDLSTLSAPDNQDAILINGAAGVTVKNLTVTRYHGNGVWIVNVQNMFGTKTYLVNNVVASFGGVYGIFARNSFGGTMSNSEAYYNNDSGFYVGETPTQTKPLRTTLTGLKSWGNELGYSGTNSKYVTITKSKWFNNGIGIVPNLLFSEDFPPPSDNIIIDNDVYGNNLNYFVGTNADGSSTAVANKTNRLQVTPFTVNYGSLGGADYPPGIGILLFGSQKTTIQNNRVWGNKLLGVGMLNPSILLTDSSSYKAVCPVGVTPSVACNTLKNTFNLKWNKIIGNKFGNLGRNQNGRDIFYANDGTANCIGGTGSNANTVGGVQSSLVTIGEPTLPKFWATCPVAASFANSGLTLSYFDALTFTDATSESGATGMGARDPSGADFVNNSYHDGRWLHKTDQAAWPTGFGTPIERCKFKVAATPLSGCVGDGK